MDITAMIHVVNTRGDLNVQHGLGPTCDAVEDRGDGIPTGTPWAKALGVGRQVGFPLRLQGLACTRRPRPFVLGGNPQRTLFRAAPCGNPRASQRGALALATELASEWPALRRGERCHPLEARRNRCLLDGRPRSRLPRSAVYPRFRPLRTSRGPGGYAVTPAPGGRGFHPHGELRYTAHGFAIFPSTAVLFRSKGRPHVSEEKISCSDIPMVVLS
jgi:hypothetical protein